MIAHSSYAQRYRELAEYCARQASEARRPADRDAWQEVADNWDKMAVEAEHRRV